MLSHLTFKQIRQLFDPVVFHGTGDITKHESGIVIDQGRFKQINEQSLKHLVDNICESIGKCITQVSYTIQDNYESNRLELTIKCDNHDKIIVIIVHEQNDNKIALWYY